MFLPNSFKKWATSSHFLDNLAHNLSNSHQGFDFLTLQIRAILTIVIFLCCLLSLIFIGFHMTLHVFLPVFSLIYLHLLFKNKTHYLISLTYLTTAILATSFVLQENNCYLCLLTSSLGILAIFSTQGLPPQFVPLLVALLLLLQKYLLYQLDEVYEEITDSYRISASAVQKAINGWFISLALEIVCFLIFHITLQRIWKHYQDVKIELADKNKSLQETIFKLENHIDELKLKNETLTQTSKSKDLLVACACHEIRNPLNIILNCLQLLNHKADNQELNTELLQNCVLYGNTLLDRVNNLLDAARLNDGKVEIATIPTKISPFLDKVWSMTRIALDKKGLQGNLSVDKSLPKYLNIDPHRLQQVLDNIIGNAIKFTTHGSVRITFYWLEETARNHQQNVTRVNSFRNQSLDDPLEIEEGRITGHNRQYLKNYLEVHNMSHLQRFISFRAEGSIERTLEENLENSAQYDRCMLRIDIVDTGCGIDELEQSRIFDPFEQANKTISHRYGGTGLGLYIVKKLVEKMDGTIKVHSLKDVGTRFQILLPVKNYLTN